ncbi:hypothetical protein DH2020_038307 [Rehmannia glutinosa]|uniref:Fe2OG dioxygenase domain-containing protein n=1 Tax=Rehmannia glutinosa TaxID=99300 RepID=A0ABR0V0B0_REHGL
MGSHPHLNKLPVVEFTETNLNPATSSWKSTADAVRRGLETYGSVVVDYYKESDNSELQDTMFGLWEELFGLPLETKRKYTSKLAGFGYAGNYPSMPLFECFGIEDGESLEAAKNFTSLMWPLGHHKFCETIHTYAKLLLELDHIVMEMLVSSYGLEKYYPPLVESSFYMTRLIKYHLPDKNNKNEINIGLRPHRDKGFLSVIGSNEVKGLQIQTPDGEWRDFEPSPSRFLILAGESLMGWSNGRIYSPLHRVIIRGGIKEKYSIGIFSFIRGILQVPEELVDHENPLKFKPFNTFFF